MKKLTQTQIKEMTKKIELEDYEGFFDDDKGLELYDYMVEQNGAYNICRGTIKKSYIQRAFEKEDVSGYLALLDGKYIGTIIFYNKGDKLYLDLICSKKIKGMPVGQLLLLKFEEYARKNKYKVLITDAVKTAVNFYKKNGWKKNGKMKDNKVPMIKRFRYKKEESFFTYIYNMLFG